MCAVLRQQAEVPIGPFQFMSQCQARDSLSILAQQIPCCHLVAKAMVCMWSKAPPGFVLCVFLESLMVVRESGWAQKQFVALDSKIPAISCPHD